MKDGLISSKLKQADVTAIAMEVVRLRKLS